MVQDIDAWRGLLVGLLGLQRGLINQEQFFDAFDGWLAQREVGVEERLIAGGSLDADGHSLLQRLAHEQLAGGDPGDSQLTVAYRDHSARREPGAGRATEASAQEAAPGIEPKFKIVRAHARGGLGEVFLAVDSRLKRQVALKAMLPDLASDPVNEARFVQEAELTAGLEHPGIVPVHALGRDLNGRPYYVMRFIEGETLRAAIARFHSASGQRAEPREKELRFRRLLQSLVAACNAVAYAHSRGVIHRDLKPDNIMLGPFGETLVLDWGIAKPSERPAARSAPGSGAYVEDGDGSLTRPGSAIGTPRYMSPEQAAADLDAIGPCSDVYGLGATLYHLLTGQAPFAQGGLTEILDRVRRGIFPAPRTVSRSVDPALETICLKAMSLRPEDRHDSALGLGEELEAWLADVRYRGEQLQALNQARSSLARLGIERAQNLFQRERYDHGMLWLARALENVPSSQPELERAVRSSLGSWYARNKLLERTIAHDGEVLAIAFSPDGRCLGTATSASAARLWDAATGHPLVAPLMHEGPVASLSFSDDGRWLASAGRDGRLRVWNAVDGTRFGTHLELGSPIRSIRFSGDGTLLAAASHAQRPCLWRTSTGEPVNRPLGHDTLATAIAFDPASTVLVAAHEDGRVVCWNTATGDPDGPEIRHDQPVTTLDLSPDGQHVITGCRDGKARVWDLAAGTLARELPMPAGIRQVRWNAARGLVAVASDDGSARLWEPQGGQPIGEPLVHEGPILCLSFSPDGTLLATGSRDRSVRLWETGHGLPIGPPLMHRGAVHALAFNPDGRRLATASSDGQARLWRVAPQLPGQVERISSWVRVTTGLDFDEADAIRKLDPLVGWELQRKLHELGGPLPAKLEKW